MKTDETILDAISHALAETQMNREELINFRKSSILPKAPKIMMDFCNYIEQMVKEIKFATIIGIPYKDGVFLLEFHSTKKGFGAQLLRIVCDEATKKNIRLQTCTAHNKLVSYYENFGFIVVKKSDHPGFARFHRLLRP